MKYRWMNGDGEWVFIPIHLIKNSFLKNVQKTYKKRVQVYEDLLIKALNKNSYLGIAFALRMLDRLAYKLSAIADEFYQREILGIHNFKNRGRTPQEDGVELPIIV